MRRASDSTETALLAGLALAGLSACAEPLQSGGVDVRPGAFARLEVVCRFARGAASPGCAEAEAEVVGAWVGRVGETSPVEGPRADARPGDWVLANEFIVAVVGGGVGGVGGERDGTPDAGRPGALLDVADAALGVSALPRLGASLDERPVRYLSVRGGRGRSGEVFVEARGEAMGEGERVSVRTRYLLRGGARSLEIVSSLSPLPPAGGAAGAPELFDRLDLGPGVSAERTRIATGGASAQPSASPFAAVLFDGGAGLLLRAEAGELTVALEAGGPPDGPAQEGRLRIAGPSAARPGERRRLVTVLPRGDALALATELHALRGGETGGLQILLGPGALPPEETAEAVLRPSDASVSPTPAYPGDLSFSVASSLAPGLVEVPAGRYRFSLRRAGDAPAGRDVGGVGEVGGVDVLVRAGEVQTLTLPDPGPS